MLNSNEDTIVQWDGNALKKMKNLQILIIKNVSFSNGPKHLSNSLKYLEWDKYPSSALPFHFNSRKLGTLNLYESCLTSIKPLLASTFATFIIVYEILDLKVFFKSHLLIFNFCPAEIQIVE